MSPDPEISPSKGVAPYGALLVDSHALENLGDSSRRSRVGLEYKGKLFDLFDLNTENLSFSEVQWILGEEEKARPLFYAAAAQWIAHAAKRSWPQAKMGLAKFEGALLLCDLKLSESLKEVQLESLQTALLEAIRKGARLQKRWVDFDEAYKQLSRQGESFQIEYLEEHYAPGSLVPLSSFDQQPDCSLICPHPFTNLPSAAYLALETLSGAYWKGDHRNPMMQRLHGRFWENQEAFEASKEALAQKKREDHRWLGKQLGFFHFQEESAGNAFWHPKGVRTLETMKARIRYHLGKQKYQEVLTPQILSRQLWEKSGHWSQFAKNMFTTQAEGKEMAIKPMSCPGHIQIFNQAHHSYRELPIRFAEFGHCHRNEPSGSHHGLMRGISFTQDDAHIFCTPSQIKEEIITCIELVQTLYKEFGFESFEVKCSTRPENRIGEETLWDKAESILIALLQELKLPFEIQEGEGAFYGPKLEFALKDSMGRTWQCGTVQIDFALPERLNAKYVDASGEIQRPILLHRAILGSLERFLGILIEHYRGALPFWLAPVHCRVLSITDQQEAYSKEVVERLLSAGLFVESDLRNEKIGLKIRDGIQQKIPLLVICGEKERLEGSLAVRTLSGETFEVRDLQTFIRRLVRAKEELQIEPPCIKDFERE